MKQLTEEQRGQSSIRCLNASVTTLQNVVMWQRENHVQQSQQILTNTD